MIIENSFHTLRKTEFKELENGWGVYRDSFTINNNEKVEVNEGICHKEDVEGLTSNSPIPENDFHLFNSKVRELMVKEIMYNIYDKLPSLVINNPYSYLEENGVENVSILSVIHRKNNMYNVYGKPIPKAIHFDPYLSRVDDTRFNLEKSLEILRKRKDITLIHKDKICVDSYLVEDGCKRYGIEFVWHPKEEDFNLVRDYQFPREVKEKVLDEILMLPRIE